MCQRTQRTMYEGKNIHYSSTDSKLLCSFSGKLCNQRRLNGYGFCVRHILEDPTAPFKQCAYVAKSSNQMCTQAIPKHEERRYCNNHMQVLGMLPKKERKKKEKPAVIAETKLHLASTGNLKAKFSLSKDNSTSVIKPAPSAGDPDDPYAFPDAGPSENKSSSISGSLPTSSDSILGKSLQSGQGFVRSASDIGNSSGLGMSGGSMIAKYYPELAEKLEKMRAKPEPKTTAKSRSRSSRTMNKLQTKIAQNKINEKLRKSQELSQTDSNSSPLQLSSPEQNVGVEHSPSPGPMFSPASSSHTFSPQASTLANFSSNLSLAGYEQGHTTQDVPPLPQVDTSFLATLAAQDNLGFQTSVSETGLSDRLLAPHTPPRLPPPYPGSSTLSTPSSLTSSDLPAGAFSPQANFNNVLDTLNPSHSPQRTTITQTGPSGPSSLPSLPFTPPHPRHSSLQNSTPPTFLSPDSSSSSFPSTGTSNYHFPSSTESSDRQPSGIKSLNNHLSSSLPPPNVDIFSMLNINSKQLSIDPQTGSQQSQMLPSPNTLAAHLSLPPPPPYVPPSVSQKVTTASTMTTLQSKQVSKATTSTATVMVTNVTPKMIVPHIKLHKLNGILTEKAAKRKLKSDFAVKFYSYYAKRKISNHCMVGPYLCSSDDDSEDEDADMLPWQRDVFSASSDEEDDDEDELGNDVPMGMRPTKLSLLKTRLRRQWCQARNAYKTNRLLRRNTNQATLALIRTVRDSAACAVRALWQIMHVKKSKRKLRKRQRAKKKICCHKNEKEGQCQNQCLPYANHCIKHITYNINQQLFDFCTAKFANNVQCCLPSFDLRHELPLCQEHAAKADNYQRQLELENKKKPRKKSKPPALTRPPRKGKKKKKGRATKVQQPVPQTDSTGLDSTLSDVDVTTIDPAKPEEGLETTSSASGPKEEESTSSGTILAQPAALTAGFTAVPKDTHKSLEHSLELEETLSPDFDKPFELPLEQASRLLDESDFQEVVNKMPFDALDLFGKNGEPEPEPDVEHMNIDLTSANKARDALEKLLTSNMSEEESMQLAMVLAQNLQTDVELAQNAGLLTEGIPSTTSHGDTRMMQGSVSIGMDISMAPHVVGVSGIDTSAVGVDHSMLTTQSSSLGDGSGLGVSTMGLHSSHQQQLQQQMLHPQQADLVHQPIMTSSSIASATYGRQDSQKLTTASLHQHQQQILSSLPSSSSTSSSTLEGVPSVFTADLNAVFGQIESLTQSQLAAKHTSGLNLNHIPGLESFSVTTAKTVIRHLPSESQPVSSLAGAAAPNQFVSSSQISYPTPQMIGASSLAQMPSQLSLEPGRSVVNLETSQAFSASSLPVINAQSRPGQLGQLHQNFTLHSSTNAMASSPSASPPVSSSPSSELLESHSLSLPSQAKKAKLALSSKPQSVISHQSLHPQSHPHQHQLQQPQQQQQQQQQQQRSATVRHMLQASSVSSNRRLTLPDANKNAKHAEKPSVSAKTQNLITSSSSPSSKRRLTLPGIESLHHQEGQKPNLIPAASRTTDSTVLKLPSATTLLADPNQSRMNVLSDSSGLQQTGTSIASSTSSSPFATSVSSNTVRYSLTADNSLTPSSLASLISTTSIRHNLLSDSNNESISVTVRHPSPLESVPTTVRHTLPDTLSTPMTLPSPPALQIPPSSSSSASSPSLQQQQAQDLNPQCKLPQTNISSQSSTSLHPELQAVLSSQRSHWVPGSSLPSNINLQNGLPFTSAASRPQGVNKHSPAGQGSVRSKPNNMASDAARISALASAAGVPVVCSPVTLPGFVQGISTTTFKSSGSS